MSRGIADAAPVGVPGAGNERIAGFGSAEGTVRAAGFPPVTPNCTGPLRNGGTGLGTTCEAGRAGCEPNGLEDVDDGATGLAAAGAAAAFGAGLAAAGAGALA